MSFVAFIQRVAIITGLLVSASPSFSQSGLTFTNLQSALIQPEKVKSLNLRKTGLKSIPPEIFSMTNLEELILEKNEIARIPDEIGKLTRLRIFDIDQNKLTSISPAIGKLKQLEELDLDKNLLSELPDEIGDLDSLTNLDVRYNELKKLPARIGNLKKLRFLQVTNNKLTELPSEIGRLSSLFQLRAENNLLNTLPPEIGNLKQLQDLFIYGNPFSTFPKEIKNLTHLGYLSISRTAAALLPEEILLNELLSDVIFSEFESSSGRLFISRKELTELILSYSKHDEAWKTMFRSQLRKKDILRRIINEGDGDFVCNKNNIRMLATLSVTYNIKECAKLTEHKNPYVRIFALRVLDQKKFGGLFEIAKKHISDDEYIHHKDYCSSANGKKYEKAGEYFMDIKSINAQQRKKLDSILIFENNRLGYTDQLIEKLSIQPHLHQRLRELAPERISAIEKLCRYKDSNDIPVLKEAIRKHEWAVRYIQLFPHPEFRELILEFRKKKRDFFQYNQDVIASFQDSFAVRLLKQDILFEEDPSREGKPKKEFHYAYYNNIYEAVYTYKCPLYNDLLCMLWERDANRRNKDVFNYIRKNDEEQAFLLAKNTLLALQGFGGDTLLVKELIQFMDSKDPQLTSEIIAKKLSMVESSTRELSFSSNSLICLLNYSAKFTSKEIQAARFTLLANSGYNSICLNVVRLILSLNDPEQDKELLHVLSRKRNTSLENATAIKKMLLKKNLLNELISISEKLPNDAIGVWFVDGIKPATENYLRGPSWATISIRSDSVYSFSRCECESEGFAQIQSNSFIRFDSIEENFPRFSAYSSDFVPNGYLSRKKNTHQYQVPLLATSAVSIPIIETYCGKMNAGDSVLLENYEKHFYKILRSVNSYHLQNDTLMLKGDGEIRLLLIGNYRTDWHYPVTTIKKLPARYKTPARTTQSAIPYYSPIPARGQSTIKKKSP